MLRKTMGMDQCGFQSQTMWEERNTGWICSSDAQHPSPVLRTALVLHVPSLGLSSAVGDMLGTEMAPEGSGAAPALGLTSEWSRAVLWTWRCSGIAEMGTEGCGHGHYGMGWAWGLQRYFLT